MIKVILQLVSPTILLVISLANVPKSAPDTSRAAANVQARAAGPGPVWLTGRTQCCPGRKASIAPVPLHPVVEVLVAAGDRVKKEQVLVKLDDDEPQADVRNKKALADSAKVALDEADRYLLKAEEMYKQGVYPEARYFAARTGAQKAKHDEQAAVAAWESAKAELEHYEVVAPIAGIISWLDVHPGTVSRPGTTVWGEILDLSEIDVRCEVSLDMVDQIKVGQDALVQRLKKNVTPYTAKVVVVGITVDEKTGLVTVVARVPNPDAVLRCGEPVQICFPEPRNDK
jgi:RND family efflux transporter MFP subunit